MPGQVVSVDREVLPNEFSLKQNYPNPFNPSTTISFSLADKCYISLEIFNQIGQKIQTVYEGEMNIGTYNYVIDMNGYSTGVYFYTLNISTGNQKMKQTKKMVLVK